jgi:hypothetical protein
MLLSPNRGHLPGTHRFTCAMVGRTSEHAKHDLGRRPTLGALIGWYAGLLQGSRSRRQGIDRHLISLAGQPLPGSSPIH